MEQSKDTVNTNQLIWTIILAPCQIEPSEYFGALSIRTAMREVHLCDVLGCPWHFHDQFNCAGYTFSSFFCIFVCFNINFIFCQIDFHSAKSDYLDINFSFPFAVGCTFFFLTIRSQGNGEIQGVHF